MKVQIRFFLQTLLTIEFSDCPSFVSEALPITYQYVVMTQNQLTNSITHNSVTERVRTRTPTKLWNQWDSNRVARSRGGSLHPPVRPLEEILLDSYPSCAQSKYKFINKIGAVIRYLTHYKMNYGLGTMHRISFIHFQPTHITSFTQMDKREKPTVGYLLGTIQRFLPAVA